MPSDRHADEVGRLKSVPWISVAVLMLSAAIPLLGVGLIGGEITNWLIENGVYEESAYPGYAFGLIFGWMSLLLGYRLARIDVIGDHIVRADTYFETVEYPLGGNDDD